MNQPGDQTLQDLIAAKISPEEAYRLQKTKDPNRRERIIALEQQRVPWPDRILVCLQEHLYVVETTDGRRIVKCDCGHEFDDYRRNWKETALVYERPDDGLIYAPVRAADPDWQILREFYCPGCGSQLDVETVPPGYPFVFNFLPDLPEDDE
jgi:acetone carboxylase gamma subunit